jgi:hypothetical protein
MNDLQLFHPAAQGLLKVRVNRNPLRVGKTWHCGAVRNQPFLHV